MSSCQVNFYTYTISIYTSVLALQYYIVHVLDQASKSIVKDYKRYPRQQFECISLT